MQRLLLCWIPPFQACFCTALLGGVFLAFSECLPARVLKLNHVIGDWILSISGICDVWCVIGLSLALARLGFARWSKPSTRIGQPWPRTAPKGLRIFTASQLSVVISGQMPSVDFPAYPAAGSIREQLWQCTGCLHPGLGHSWPRWFAPFMAPFQYRVL
jgi:hypothetical protein